MPTLTKYNVLTNVLSDFIATYSKVLIPTEVARDSGMISPAIPI